MGRARRVPRPAAALAISSWQGMTAAAAPPGWQWSVHQHASTLPRPGLDVPAKGASKSNAAQLAGLPTALYVCWAGRGLLQGHTCTITTSSTSGNFAS